MTLHITIVAPLNCLSLISSHTIGRLQKSLPLIREFCQSGDFVWSSYDFRWAHRYACLQCVLVLTLWHEFTTPYPSVHDSFLWQCIVQLWPHWKNSSLIWSQNIIKLHKSVLWIWLFLSQGFTAWERIIGMHVCNVSLCSLFGTNSSDPILEFTIASYDCALYNCGPTVMFKLYKSVLWDRNRLHFKQASILCNFEP